VISIKEGGKGGDREILGRDRDLIRGRLFGRKAEKEKCAIKGTGGESSGERKGEKEQ